MNIPLQTEYIFAIIEADFVLLKKGGANMRYVCLICGYVYDESEGDPDNGIEPGTLWEDLPEDFECPLCGVSKDDFEKDVEAE